jgi:hypothetical protein
MAGLKKAKGYDNYVVNICPNDTEGKVVTIGGLDIQLPKTPPKKEILNHDRGVDMQMWQRLSVPIELQRLRSMGEWYEMPSDFKKRFSPYIEEEFKRRREGLWFYNNGEPVYITGRH